MPEIVRERDRFREIFVQSQSARDRATDRRDFDRMRQARAQMIARAIEKNLRLVFEPAKCARMNDARAIALKLRAIGMTLLGYFRPRESPDFCANGASVARSVASISSRDL